MHVLHPWLMTLPNASSAFKLVMVELGVTFDDDWADKESVTRVINQLCQTQFAQSDVWRALYDSRKSLNAQYSFLFPNDPLFQRKRTWCHLYEAWYTIAIVCTKQGCLHHWIRHFNLADDSSLITASQLIFDGTIIVNGLHIEGAGLIKL